MSLPHSILVSALLAILLVGCKKSPTAPTPKLGETSGSVAAPQSTMPLPDAKMPVAPSSAVGGSGDANSPSQANPSELSKGQESTAMPLPGQANTHSSPSPVGEKK